ncbi:MAG: hypothetical protein CMH56_14995 [Myxococcales bacterium]|nr:hypothetical protein [Myxococcales bacterium]|tara:strand:+ start:815 stop:2104 length:1290 start_codon:yes stop_codon:yes gene_type:complete
MIFSTDKRKKPPWATESHSKPKLELLLLVISGTIPLGERLLDVGFMASGLYLLANWNAFWTLVRRNHPVGQLMRAVLIFCAICGFGAWAAGFEGGLQSASRLREHGVALVFCVGLFLGSSQLRWQMAGVLAIGTLVSVWVAHLQFNAGLVPFADFLGISAKQQGVLHPGLPGHLAGSGLLYDRIPFSILTLMFGVFALGASLTSGLATKTRFCFMGAALLALTGPLVAGSRMAILLIPVGIVGVGWPLGQRLFKQTNGKFFVFAGVLLVSLGIVLGLFGAQTQFRSVADTAQNQDRVFIWERATEVFVDKPIFGTGYGHYPVVTPTLYHSADPKKPAKNHAHNLLLTLLAETGMIGFWAFVWMMGCFYRQARRWAGQGLSRGAFWACMMFFLSSLVHDPLFQSNTLACFWLFVCIASVPMHKGVKHDAS